MAPRRERRRRTAGRGGAHGWRLSVRSRIVVSILVATALGLAASGGASYLVQRERALASVDEQLLHAVPELKSIAAGTTSTIPPTTVDEVLRAAMQQLIPAPDQSVLGFINDEPALVPAAGLPFRIDDDPDLVERLVSEAHPTNVVTGTAKSPLGTLRYLIVPVSVAGDTDTGLYVAAYDLDAVLNSVAQSFQTYIVVALIALALVGLVAWFVSGRLLRPIRLLREAAAANTAADLSERIPVRGRDDLSELTETINDMFARLESAFTSQRRLINDVGHELKTPLTIIRGHLELLEIGNTTDVETTRVLAIDEVDRMSNLVSEISLLAESETPNFTQTADVDIATLTTTVAAKAYALDLAREWRVESGAHGLATMDARRITQAWLQLAQNAAKYSSPGTPIVIASELTRSRSGSWIHFSVRDAGPGIPKDAQERIFERFGRLESSRGTEGSGLGLAIASAIASAHGGAVLLTSSPEGSTFTIRIPLREPSAPSQEYEEQ